MAAPLAVPTLTDGVVTIRAHRREDARRAFEQCADPLSQQWTRVPIPYSLTDAERFVTEAMPGGWETNEEWAFAIDVGGEFGGTVSLRNEGEGRAEIAYGAHPAIRGTGAVERALRLLLDWGFEAMELETIIWWAHVGNWASRRVAWRLGFSFDGTVRHWQPQRAELHDGWVGTLLRGEAREPRTTWLDCPVLTGDGLVLRPFGETDAPRIVESCADERAQHWLTGLPTPYAEHDARTYVEQRTAELAAGEGATWAVTEPDVTGDVVLASVGYFDLAEGVAAEIGYWTHPGARGRGVMTRATRRVLAHCFDDLDLDRVRAVSAVDNPASRHVLEANGFVLAGVERGGTRGGAADAAVYDLLAAEFRTRVIE